MGWIFVFFAAALELIGVWGLNLVKKRRTIKNGIIFFVGFGASFGFIHLAFGYLPTSIAYTVWIGVSTAGAVIMNMIFFGESKNWFRIASLTAIIIGVIGLKRLS